MADDPNGHAQTQWVKGVVERYEAPLLLYAQRLAGDDEGARDAVQETFLKLCRQSRQDVEGHLAEWLYSVCRNVAIDAKRKERRMVSMTQDEIARPGTEVLPERSLEQKEQAARLARYLDGLPPNQQEVLRLKFQHGMSYKQISEITRLTVTNVGFLIHTGLKALRTRLAEDAQTIS